MTWGNRKATRVQFQRGLGVQIVGIDGAWRRDGRVLDISDTGVLLSYDGSLKGLDLRSFLLEFGPKGMASRRCALVRLDTGRIGARFVKDAVL